MIRFFILTSALLAWSHEGHHSKQSEKPPTAEQQYNLALAEISKTYKTNVEPIFRKACFDCHGQAAKLPWYYSLPLVKNLIDDDIKEAKTHLDFSVGFPFKGHGTPKEDLEAIGKVISEKSMPPLRYKIMNSGLALSDEDSVQVINWSKASLSSLSEKK